jgi:hypothetical protein
MSNTHNYSHRFDGTELAFGMKHAAEGWTFRVTRGCNDKPLIAIPASKAALQEMRAFIDKAEAMLGDEQ